MIFLRETPVIPYIRKIQKNSVKFPYEGNQVSRYADSRQSAWEQTVNLLFFIFLYIFLDNLQLKSYSVGGNKIR